MNPYLGNCAVPGNQGQRDPDLRKTECRSLLKQLELANKDVRNSLKNIFKRARKLNQVRADSIRERYNDGRTEMGRLITRLIQAGGEGVEDIANQYKEEFTKLGQGLLSMFSASERGQIIDSATFGSVRVNQAKNLAIETAMKCDSVLEGKEAQRLANAQIEAVVDLYSAGVFFNGISPPGPPT
jgi:hypothetical protein